MATIKGITAPALLRLIWWDTNGARRVEAFQLRSSNLHVTNDVSGGRLNLEGNLIAQPLPDRSTLVQRLADAILEGDDVAAYGLADDILEQRARPEEFVERAVLLLDLQRTQAEAARLQARLDDRVGEFQQMLANAKVTLEVGS